MRRMKICAFCLVAALLSACSFTELLTPTETTSVEEVVSEASSQTSSGTSSASGKIMPRKPPKTVADALKLVNYEHGKNPDTVAWLVVPGTDINNSVVQAHDNLVYLRLTERKEPDIYGCYFADYECSFGTREQLSQNTVIYGHSDLKDNRNGPRFSQLFRFTEEEFAVSNPCMSLTTPSGQTLWQIFAVFYTGTDMPYIAANPGEQFPNLLAQARGKSLYDYKDVPSATDKILTLSTCSVKYGARTDQRFVVMAYLLPEDAKAPAQAALTLNSDPLPAFPGENKTE